MEVHSSTSGYRFRVDPMKQEEGWVTVKYAATEDEMLENIAEALEKAYDLGRERGRFGSITPPPKRRKNG